VGFLLTFGLGKVTVGNIAGEYLLLYQELATIISPNQNQVLLRENGKADPLQNVPGYNAIPVPWFLCITAPFLPLSPMIKLRQVMVNIGCGQACMLRLLQVLCGWKAGIRKV
jgi:hypothetical protein